MNREVKYAEDIKLQEITGIKQKVFEEIRAFAEKRCLHRVVLFGSRARGDYGRASDIDLAVLGGDILSFTMDMKEETSTLLEFDVVDLGHALKKEFVDSVQGEGILLYEKI